jgi:GT2 family glycosyltransferase
MKQYTNKISVIIPTFKSVKTIIKTIDSLLKQTYPIWEIIVIDNASPDQTNRILKIKFGQKIKIFSLEKNLGVTGGRNFGIKQVSPKSEMLLFIDHDMIADKDMLKLLVQGFQISSNIGITTPKIFYKNPKNVIWSAGTGINLWTGQVLFRGGKDVGQFDQPMQVQVAPAVLLVRKEVIKKVKEFDSIYFATFEDTDFCFKAKKFGFLTYYIPTAKAYHDLPYDDQNAQMRLLNRLYYIGRNRLIFLRRHGRITAVPMSLGFSLYYLYLAFKYRRLSEFLNYLKGTIDGMTIRV